MKRLHQLLGIGAIAAALAAPVVFSTPVWAQLQQVGQTVAQNLQRQPQVQLLLSAEKSVVITNDRGQLEKTWQMLNGQVAVQPGDLLRYSLKGQNVSDRAARNLVVTQPIPNQMKYVLDSAVVSQNTDAEITYSIDSGKTYTAQPTVEVTLPDGTVESRPAPAEAYTHIRWDFGSSVNAGTTVNAAYQVQVR